jgi:hypothetical protein
MSKLSKIKEKIKCDPVAKDFTWIELNSLLTALGYKKKRGVDQGLSFFINRLTTLFFFINLILETRLSQGL